GIRLYGLKNKSIIKNNHIKTGFHGLRILDTSDVEVINNSITDSTIGIEVTTQVYNVMKNNQIIKNKVNSENTPIRINSENVLNTFIDENTLLSELDTFQYLDMGSDTIIGVNYSKPTNNKPIGRGSKGEYKKNTEISYGKPLGWISLNTNGNATWESVHPLIIKKDYIIEDL